MLGLCGGSEHIIADSAEEPWLPRGRQERVVLPVSLPSTRGGSGRSSSTSACIAEVLKKSGLRLTTVMPMNRLVFGIGEETAQA